MSKKVTYLYCPCCGKSSLVRNFLAGAAGDHALGARTQTALSRPGVEGGWKWESRPIAPEEVQLLADAVATVSRRLQRLRFSTRTPEELTAYVKELEDELQFSRDLLHSEGE